MRGVVRAVGRDDELEHEGGGGRPRPYRREVGVGVPGMYIESEIAVQLHLIAAEPGEFSEGVNIVSCTRWE